MIRYSLRNCSITLSVLLLSMALGTAQASWAAPTEVIVSPPDNARFLH